MHKLVQYQDMGELLLNVYTHVGTILRDGRVILRSFRSVVGIVWGFDYNTIWEVHLEMHAQVGALIILVHRLNNHTTICAQYLSTGLASYWHILLCYNALL